MDVIGDVNQTKFWLLAIEVPTSWRNMDDLVVTVASLFSPRSSNPGLGPQTASFCPNLMLDLRHRGICCQAFTTPKDLKKRFIHSDPIHNYSLFPRDTDLKRENLDLSSTLSLSERQLEVAFEVLIGLPRLIPYSRDFFQVRVQNLRIKL